MTVLEVIQRSAEFLERKGVDSPRLQAELLLADTLRLPRLQLYLLFERVLTREELEVLRDRVRRRARREPLQQIVGSTSFCGFDLSVTPAVMIPRPETELLAEQAWSFLQSHNAAVDRVLDLGTGSGCLAIAVAAHRPNAQITATDISPAAIAVARTNAARHGFADRIAFLEGDLFAPLARELPFDLIVSNPPYIPTPEIATLQPEVRDYDPRLALDGGPDGLDFYRRLAREANPFLAPGGRLMVEFGDQQHLQLPAVFDSAGWVVQPPLKDYTQRERILIIERPPE